LILFSKISIFLFKSIFDGIIFKENSRSNELIGIIGSVLIGIFIGIISSMLLKQDFTAFMIINIIMVLIINIQEIINNKIQSLLQSNNIGNSYFKYFVSVYNDLLLTFSFLVVLISTGVIKF
jgi:hypothetical protein